MTEREASASGRALARRISESLARLYQRTSENDTVDYYEAKAALYELVDLVTNPPVPPRMQDEPAMSAADAKKAAERILQDWGAWPRPKDAS